MINLALRYLEEHEERPSAWLDLCIEFADSVMQWAGKRGLHVEPITIECLDGILHSPVGEGWCLHQAILCGGRVHDMYVEHPIALGDYLQVMFPDQRLRVEYPDRPGGVYDIWRDGVLELRVDTDDVPAVA